MSSVNDLLKEVLIVLEKHKGRMFEEDYDNVVSDVKEVWEPMNNVLLLGDLSISPEGAELIDDDLHPVYVDSEDGGGCNLYDSSEVLEVLGEHGILTDKLASSLTKTDYYQVYIAENK